MLHLFKEVYVSFDTNIDSRVHRVVISKENGHKDPSSPTLLGHAQEYTDLIGRDKAYPSLLEFLEFLSAKQTETGEIIQVYLDKQAFTTLTANWFRAVFADSTSASSYKFLVGYLSEIFMPSVNVMSPTMPVDLFITEEEFTAAYNSTVEVYGKYGDFVQSMISELSIELLVASNLANGSVKPILSQRLQEMELSDIESFMKETKSDIYRGLMNSKFTTDNGLQSYTLENLADVATDPGMDFFWPIYADVYNNFKNGTRTWDSITDESVDTLHSRVHAIADSIFGCSQSTSIDRLTLLKYISEDVMSDASFDAVMEFEIASPTSFRSAKFPTFNAYFMDYILEPIRTNGDSTVAPYIIRGCK